jgi:Putative zinc-finger
VPDQDHPDQEQLAAYQAGDVDRRERLDVEAHLAACTSCAELIASVGRARGSLALLEEPDLPPGLHDRLTAAVETEVAAAQAGADGAEPALGRLGWRQRAGSRTRSGSQRSGEPDREPRVLRPAPWFRRPLAWGAAAALILAAVVVPFLAQGGGLRTTAGGDTGAGGGAQEAATQGQVAPGNVPVFRVQGEVTAETVRRRLETDPQAKAALGGAAAASKATDQDAGALRSGTQTPAPGTQPQSTSGQAYQPDADTETGSPGAGTEGPSPGVGAEAPSAGALQRQSCLPAAAKAADPAARPLVPAFFIEGTYEGREATILVTTSTGRPNRVDLWVFPRGDCTSPLLATKRVR